MKSPYDNHDISEWKSITNKLINSHPLKTKDIVRTVLEAWNEIFDSSIGNYKIGIDIFPKPQIVGFFLHELIALKFQTAYPTSWRVEKNVDDKDIVCIENPLYSIELKTSSSDRNIYGNRSYSQNTETDKKSKSGYYLAVNFQKFTNSTTHPKIISIRFGWLDHDDWIGQKSQSGQQARLSRDVEQNKLISIYSNS